jgi:hypothetical protein
MEVRVKKGSKARCVCVCVCVDVCHVREMRDGRYDRA